jgi:hypothetical protein
MLGRKDEHHYSKRCMTFCMSMACVVVLCLTAAALGQQTTGETPTVRFTPKQGRYKYYDASGVSGGYGIIVVK